MFASTAAGGELGNGGRGFLAGRRAGVRRVQGLRGGMATKRAVLRRWACEGETLNAARMRVAFVCDRDFAVVGRGFGAEVVVQCVCAPAGGLFSLQTEFLFFETLGEAGVESFFLGLEVFSCFCEGGFGFEEFVVEMLDFRGARGEFMV